MSIKLIGIDDKSDFLGNYAFEKILHVSIMIKVTDMFQEEKKQGFQ